jgi:Flp pilus assembly pilin Flp
MSAGSAHFAALRRDAKGGRTAMQRLLKFFSRNDAENEPIEYGVIAVGLTLALVVVLAQLGGALTTAF